MINLDKLTDTIEAMTPGDWELWTSNSFRRITAHRQQDGGVLHGSVHRDGQPDLDGNNREADLAGIIALRNAAPHLLRIAKAAKAWSKTLLRPRGDIQAFKDEQELLLASDEVESED